MIYLDNAATTSPKPRLVAESVITAINLSANPGRSGHIMSQKASEYVFDVRKKLNDFFSNNAVERIIFTQNCTHSLNIAIKGIVKKGDHVVASSFEHNSVMRVLYELQENGIITYDTAFVHPDNDEMTLNSFESCIKSNTSLIICSHASNVFGYAAPIEKIGKIAKSYGAKFIVDGAQSAGMLNINMGKMNIDVLCIPGHKGIYGIMGTGVLLLNKDCDPKSLMVGGTGSESLNLQQPNFYPDKMESGTLNLPGVMSLGAGIDFIRAKGIENIHNYEAELCIFLHECLGKIDGVKIYSKSYYQNAPIVAFNYKDIHSEKIASYLNRYGICLRAGYHCSYSAHKNYGTTEQGVVRVSFSIYNTKSEIKKLINCLNEIEKK